MSSNVVGLTGGIGSGKTAVAKLFAAYGIPCVDTDEIARTLTSADGLAIPLIKNVFGEQAIDADGAMHRAWMRQRVFDNPAERHKLESLLHPLIKDQSQLAATSLSCSAPYVLLAVPLLFETGTYLDFICGSLVVDCKEELQIQRVMRRSGLTAGQVQQIMCAQLSRPARRERADWILENNGDLALLSEAVGQLHKHFLARFGCGQP